MILQNKNAIIYGAGGSLGSAVAKAFADAGAKVFLTGRNVDSVQKVANKILESGGKAEVHKVDATNEEEINSHIKAVKQRAGSVDISFNAIGIDVVMNIPLADMSVGDYVNPITKTIQTRFLTAKAAAKIMIEQKSGVILTLTAKHQVE